MPPKKHEIARFGTCVQGCSFSENVTDSNKWTIPIDGNYSSVTVEMVILDSNCMTVEGTCAHTTAALNDNEIRVDFNVSPLKWRQGPLPDVNRHYYYPGVTGSTSLWLHGETRYSHAQGSFGVDAGDYNTLYVCSNGLDPVTSGVGTSLGFTLNKGENIVCTFTNEIKRGSIFGYKYEDLSGDLSDDGDQTPVQGLLVQLWQWVVDQFIDTGLSDTTDANGYYEFLNLLPALYQVREVLNSLGGGWTNYRRFECH